jgi:TolB-like protein
MGEVYRAHDTRLGRDVAVKVLPAVFAAEPDRLRRFEHEARAASGLNHPHICTIHDIDEHDGRHFIAMELLEGQTLKERLSGQPLPALDVVEIGLQLADALEAAHAKGIVHRDVKPANIFLTSRGPVKLLDFGLAKGAEAPHAAPDAPTAAAGWETEAGVTLGTVGYMSPEQARGEVVDARTDLFSLGVVLYEMATGTTPFRGASAGAVLGEILTQTPTSPAQLNPTAPAELARIITKALEKDRELRYQSARDLLVDLTRLKRERESERAAAPGAPASRVPSLAVLPFANLSGDKENEYFSDGLAEDIIDALAQVPGLRVMARTSSFSFRGKEADVREIGARLNVEHILEGSVRRAGNCIRVTAQLVNACDGCHLWSQRFDRELTDVFAIQDEISQAIVEKLRVRLSGERPLVRRYTEDLAAYDLCLRARYHIFKLTQEGREAGRRYCEQAVALDPKYALAYVVLAESYFWDGFWGSTDPREGFARAKSAALEALRLDDTIADAHSALGTALGSGEFEWQRAAGEFRRAEKLSLRSAAAGYDYAWYYSMYFLLPLGRVQEALAELQRALGRDPLDPFYNALAGYLLFASRQFERAVAQLQHTIDLDPTFFFSYWFLSILYARQGRLDDAIAASEKANELSGGTAITIGDLGKVYALAGRTAQARQLLEELSRRRQSAYVPACAFLFVHGGLGEREDAIEWMARGVDEHDPILMTSLKASPSYDALRLHPAYRELLKKMRLEP